MAPGEDPCCFGRMHIFSRTVWASLGKSSGRSYCSMGERLGAGAGHGASVEKNARPRRALLVHALWSLVPLLANCDVLSPLPCVLIGKPSSFFPEDSFIDSGEIDVGRRASQKIPPGTFWRSQVFIDHPVHLKFNVSLGKAALIGIYGRKGLPPSHTQVTKSRPAPDLQGLLPQILTQSQKV